MSRASRRQHYRPTGEQLESRALMTAFAAPAARGPGAAPGEFEVTNTFSSGPGSFRIAITRANAHPGPDIITFNIPGPGPHFIDGPGMPGAITGKVIIDGYSQPGSSPNTSQDPNVNNAQIMINIVNRGFGGPTLVVRSKRANGSQIRGLGIFSKFSPAETEPQWGLELRNANFVTVDGCAIAGTEAAPLSQAVVIRGGDHNTIGSDLALTPARRNVMSGYDVGIDLVGDADHNSIVGNRVGGEVNPLTTVLQVVGVRLRQKARHNTVIRNLLFKNVYALANDGQHNDLADNTVVPPSA